MPEQTNFEKLEELLISAPANELPGLLEHARLVARICGMRPAKRPYVKKNGNALSNVTEVAHSASCTCGCTPGFTEAAPKPEDKETGS